MFPPSFFIGAATAGHQVEGHNVNTDCWVLEHLADSIFPEPSGDAADFYHRWPHDVSMAADLGLRALRFSLEWSRIEPAPGEFSLSHLDHYRRLAAACREAGMATVVTFNHWTTPIWFAADGGWENPASVDRFARFTDAAAAHLTGEVDWALTLNEPNLAAVVGAGGGPVVGSRTGSRQALEEAGRLHPVGSIGFRAMMLWEGDQLERYTDAHRQARDVIKAHMDVPVGWSLACEDYQAVPGHEADMEARRRPALTDWLEASRDDDFVGVQNYTRRLLGPAGVQLPDGTATNDLGWELHPPSLANAAAYAAEVSGRPVVVTEHGVATWDDEVRLDHTRRSLELLARAVADGVDVRGYLHWTLLDEFEWLSGYTVTFGLVAVDRKDFQRAPRPSAHWLGRLARSLEPR